MKIFCKTAKVHDGRDGFDWAWEESKNNNVWGWDSTLEDVKRRAVRMFPMAIIELVML